MITLPSVGVWRGYRYSSAHLLAHLQLLCSPTCNCVHTQAMITESLPGPQHFGPLCIRRHALVCLLTRWHLDNSLMPTHNTTSHVCPITGNTYTTHLPTLTYGTQDTSQGPDITGHMCERLNVSSYAVQCTWRTCAAYIRGALTPISQLPLIDH
jgi:hypothetical protein